MSEVLKIGIMPREQFQKRLLDVAAGRTKINKNTPKVWFSSTKSLSRALVTKSETLAD